MALLHDSAAAHQIVTVLQVAGTALKGLYLQAASKGTLVRTRLSGLAFKPSAALCPQVPLHSIWQCHFVHYVQCCSMLEIKGPVHLTNRSSRADCSQWLRITKCFCE